MAAGSRGGVRGVAVRYEMSGVRRRRLSIAARLAWIPKIDAIRPVRAVSAHHDDHRRMGSDGACRQERQRQRRRHQQPLQERTIDCLGHLALLCASKNEAEMRLLTGISILTTLLGTGRKGYNSPDIRQMTALSRLRLRPWQDFDKTEMSLRPRRGLSIRFGAGRLAVARRGTEFSVIETHLSRGS